MKWNHPGFSQPSFTLMCSGPGDKKKFAELLGILWMCRAGDWNPVEQSIEGLCSLSTHQISLTGARISFHWQQEYCPPGVAPWNASVALEAISMDTCPQLWRGS